MKIFIGLFSIYCVVCMILCVDHMIKNKENILAEIENEMGEKVPKWFFPYHLIWSMFLSPFSFLFTRIKND